MGAWLSNFVISIALYWKVYFFMVDIMFLRVVSYLSK